MPLTDAVCLPSSPLASRVKPALASTRVGERVAVQVLEHVALLAAVEAGKSQREGLRAAASAGVHQKLLSLQRVVTAAGGDLRCAPALFCLPRSLAPTPLPHTLMRALPA